MTKRRFRESRQSRAKIMEGNHQVAAAEAVKDSRKQPTRSREGRERDGKGRDILKKLLSLNPLLDSLNSSTTSPPKELLRPRPPIKHSEAPKRPRKRIPSATLNNKVSEFDAAESTISICRICGSAIDHEYKQNCGIESVANSLQATPNIACDWPPLLNSTTDANHTYYRSAAAAQGEMFAHEILENLLDQSLAFRILLIQALRALSEWNFSFSAKFNDLQKASMKPQTLAAPTRLKSAKLMISII
ncbi:MAG: hypothetical protein MHMPM18_004509 [Marteilia pararefringens]